MSSSSSSSSPAPSRSKRKRTVENQVDADSDTLSSGLQNDESEPPVEEEDNLPVLSHAAKRRQKRAELKSLDRGDDSSVPKKKRKLKDGTAGSNHVAKDVKRQNSVWVGNMSFKTTEENIRVFFKEKGAVEVTRINLPTKVIKGPGLKAENQGFAYVDFETPEAKKVAIALSEQPLLGRKLLIKDGDDFTGRPSTTTEMTMTTSTGVKKSFSKSAQKVLKNQKQPPAPTLFFGNLSFDTTENSIRELLEAHRDDKGKKHKGRRPKEDEDEEEEKNNNNNNNKGNDLPWIRKVRLSTFEDSGKCKGFAFVDFQTTEHATSALINLKNHHLNGRDLVVEYASADAVRRGAPKGPHQKSSEDVIQPPIQTRQKKPNANTKDTSSQKKTGVDEKAESAQIPLEQKEGSHSKWKSPAARDRGGRKPKGRPKPGAALALAKRESAAIVPSLGQKITF